jgi:hypothetical protein
MNSLAKPAPLRKYAMRARGAFIEAAIELSATLSQGIKEQRGSNQPVTARPARTECLRHSTPRTSVRSNHHHGLAS